MSWRDTDCICEGVGRIVDVFTLLFPKVKSSHITALVNAIRRCNNDFGVNDVQEILEYVEGLNYNE